MKHSPPLSPYVPYYANDHAGIYLYNVNCFDLMQSLSNTAFDLVLTDPPYGITNSPWDNVPPLQYLWLCLKSVSHPKTAFVFTSAQPFTSELVMSNPKWFRCEWIWQKSISSGFLSAKYKPLRLHENVIVFYNKRPTYNPQMTPGSPYTRKQSKPGLSVSGDPNVLKGGYVTVSDGRRFPTTILPIKNSRGLHPTQKPVELARYFIRTYSNPGDTIFDPFSGSGFAAVAALIEGRRFVGTELDPHFCSIAKQQLESVPPPLIPNPDAP